MDLSKLKAPLERQLGLLGYELVHLEGVREGRDEILRLYMDHLPAGDGAVAPVTLDDCVAVHEGLLAWLDVEFPSLRETTGIEISSPGLNRPLVKPEHFRRFQGRLCKAQTLLPVNGQKRFKGWIHACGDTELTLEEDGVLKTLPLDNLQKAHLAPFDEEKAPKPKHAADAEKSVG